MVSTHERRFAHNNIGHTIGVAAGTIGLLKANRFVSQYGIPFVKKSTKKKVVMAPGGKRGRSNSGSSWSTASNLKAIKGYRTPPRSGKKQKRTVNFGRGSSTAKQLQGLFAKKAPRRHVTVNNNSSVTTSSKAVISKSFKQADYQKHGSVICLESGGTKEDPNCVYVGAGTPLQDYYYAACRSLVYALVKKAGRDIVNWNDRFSIVTQHQIDITFIANSLTTQSYQSIAVTPLESYQTVAENIAKRLQVFFGGEANVHWMEAVLYEFTDALTKPIVTAIVNLQQFMLDMEVGINVNVQNQTPSDSSSFSTEVINANPVTGKMYVVNGNFIQCKNVSNTIDPETAEQLSVGWCTALSTRGEFADVPFDKATKKPPPASMFARLQKSESLKIAPGECHIVKATRTQTFSWTVLMQKLQQQFHIDLPASYFKNTLLGCAVVVAMEKVMDTRLATEVYVTLGYQTEVYIKCKHHYKKTAMSAIINECEANDVA